jgi:trehalose synthase-fused probable maltokinase
MAAEAAWIAAQRWFRAKHRVIDAVVEFDHAPLGGVDLGVLEVRYADGGAPDRYLAPTVHGREPGDGDGAWTAIVAAVADDATIRGTRGAFQARAMPALAELLPSPSLAVAALTERSLGVEQSNTSVALGDRLMLKVYRLLEPGENPDLELSAFLTDAGFTDTPAVAGGMTWQPDDGEPAAAAAMLQEFVPSTGDAWAAMLDSLRTDPSAAIEIAARVGDVTARMHAALVSRPSDPFPSRPATVAETAAWRASAQRQLAQAVTAVSGDANARLVELAPRITARFADSFGTATGEARVSRIHGDFHLGQLLARPDGGFSVIDFEGEPARPLAERRAPNSPLRDVAGMLRSLDYAARTSQRGRSGLDADAWLRDARAAFRDGYGRIEPADEPLLDAFELEKACYEVRYEASNRPEWLWLPLSAVERLAAGS